MNSGKELRLLLASLCNLHREDNSRAALATITRTHGSSFRHSGTHMLVWSDGDVVCELSAGCPQREIVERALEVILASRPRLVNYNSESVFDVLMEMGCGGKLEVLIEPLSEFAGPVFARELQHCIDQRRKAWLATWFACENSVIPPRRLVFEGNRIRHRIYHNELDDPLLLQSILQSILDAIDEQSDRSETLRLPASHGAADVLIEPVPPPHALAIIGSGATPRALLSAADALGWHITLVDSSPERLRAAGMPPGLRRVCARPDNVREKLALDAFSSVVVMTHKLEQDIAYLDALRDTPAAYLGALASRERGSRIREALAGCYVHAPAGLDIGSETPAEIALAVVAEITAVLNRRSGGRLRDSGHSIHG